MVLTLARVQPLLKLTPNAPFTREALGEDVKRIKEAIIADGYLAPQLEEPRVERDAERNLMTISLKGAVGPKVKVDIPDYPLSEKAKRDLLPVMREGNIDVSAIEEGARRLRNRLQEEGYFFAEITSVCKVTPPIPAARIKRRCGDLRKSESGSVERPFGGDYATRLKEDAGSVWPILGSQEPTNSPSRMSRRT